jgi:hypothetical protein
MKVGRMKDMDKKLRNIVSRGKYSRELRIDKLVLEGAIGYIL